MNKSNEVHELVASLAQAQLNFGEIKKTSKNPFTLKKYVSIWDIDQATKKSLAEHNLILISSYRPQELLVTLLHASGQFIDESLPIKSPEKFDTIEKFYSYSAPVKRNLIANILGIALDEEDDDGLLILQETEEYEYMNNDQVANIAYAIGNFTHLGHELLRQYNVISFDRLPALDYTTIINKINENVKAYKLSRIT